MSKKAILDLTSSSPCMRKQEERDGKGKETVLSTDREENGVFWGRGCEIPWSYHFSCQSVGVSFIKQNIYLLFYKEFAIRLYQKN